MQWIIFTSHCFSHSFFFFAASSSAISCSRCRFLQTQRIVSNKMSLTTETAHKRLLSLSSLHKSVDKKYRGQERTENAETYSKLPSKFPECRFFQQDKQSSTDGAAFLYTNRRESKSCLTKKRIYSSTDCQHLILQISFLFHSILKTTTNEQHNLPSQ